MRCPYCGNENQPDHRFCGMCGRQLSAPAAEAPAPEPAHPRQPEPSSSAPAYTGGIFNLGASSDRPYQSLDYLLEDDEEPKTSKGLMFLIVLALAIAVGLGYLRWRSGGLPWIRTLTASSSKPAPTPTTTDGSANAAPAEPPAGTSTAKPADAPPAPVPNASSPAPANSPSTNAPAPTTPSPDTAAAAKPETPPAANAPAGGTTTESTEPTTTATPTERAPEAAPPAAEPAPPPKAKPAPKPVPKPAPKPPAPATDQVTMGEKYLYGRGVPQNCERGLRYVKPAAEQSNTKAMITMGALYATGHCISRDLPTAYRFFALALRSDPENGPLRQNAEMVWKQMTAEERKQAIRLTQ